MGKYFFKNEERHGDCVTLTGQSAHHLINVMRVGVGCEVILCDGMNSDFMAKVVSLNDKPAAITFNLLSQQPSKTETLFPITLFQGLPKGDKMEWIIEKAVECGVAKIIPVSMARSVVKIKDSTKKAERFSRIAESAAAQSMRGIIPDVLPPQSFTSALAYADDSFNLVAYENENNDTVKSSLKSTSPRPTSLWIGPEGGFDNYEIQALKDIGAITISLGPRILRTETAGIVAISQIIYHWDK